MDCEVKPTKCGKCRWFLKTDFEEEGQLAIGHCTLFPASCTRRFNDGPCGIWPMILEIMEEGKCKSPNNG